MANPTIYHIERKELWEMFASVELRMGKQPLLIPDLQRPYVWKPDQVVLLVDSLLKGWPFGTLLFWDVSAETARELEGLSRPFWRSFAALEAGSFDNRWTQYQPPGTDRDHSLVLDGQQRLQSLFIAFGGESNGFTFHDRTWADLLEVPRPQATRWREYWTSALLCLDTEKYLEQCDAGLSARRIDYRAALNWVGGSARTMWGREVPAGYQAPLPKLTGENRNRYLPMYLLWQWADMVDEQEECAAYLRQWLPEQGFQPDQAARLADRLQHTLALVKNVRHTDVSLLRLLPFGGKASERDNYLDTVVSIFTRLNKGGTVLTEQQITFAWLKSQWKPELTGGRNAQKCFWDLEQELAKVYGVSPGTDEVVRMVSALWSVLQNSAYLLGSRDLLKGEYVRPLAKWVNEHWTLVSNSILEAVAVLAGKGLRWRIHYQSINALVVLAAWCAAARYWREARKLTVTQGRNFDDAIQESLVTWVDRWVMVTSWATKWGASGEFYMRTTKDLFQLLKSLEVESDEDKVARAFDGILAGWIEECKEAAVKRVREYGVATRDQVHGYFTFLWVWHRLRPERKRVSEILLREEKSKTKVPRQHVDHVVSHSTWETRFMTQAPDDERVINDIGNMELLEADYNINKSCEDLVIWTAKVGKLRSPEALAEWRGELLVTDLLFQPSSDWAEVRAEIEKRGQAIREELVRYVTDADPMSSDDSVAEDAPSSPVTAVPITEGEDGAVSLPVLVVGEDLDQSLEPAS